MLGKADASSGGDGNGLSDNNNNDGTWGPVQGPGGNRRTFWRSASWSSSRTSLPPLNPDSGRDGDPNGNGNNVLGRRFPPAPLTPRSQHSFKNRSSLPPLSIARRSLDEWPKAGSDDIGEWPMPSTPSGRDSCNSGERLKLDLSNIQQDSDWNGGLVKREKIAFFDKKCSKVADHIYLGGEAVAKDKDILVQHGITHILNCVGFVCPEYFKSDFVYRTLWLQDSPSEDITSILYDVFDYFEDVREWGGRIFVHCCQGVSRSTSLVIAYLMWREGQSFEDAFQYVKAARGIADPNMGFACQLLQCQKRVHAFPLSPSSLLRMYRIAPHSPYDPLHLVPKMLNDPSPSSLDSRGAFIIQIPSAIYVWVGKNCEAIMERDARGAVCQIVRYEKVQGQVTIIREGEEPSYFWDAFSNLLPLMVKSNNGDDVVESSVSIRSGERKVESYNLDFEYFLKATAGGFVPPFGSSDTEHETRLPARESCWSDLRRKFVSGHMKEFVSGSNSGVSKLHINSMFVTSDCFSSNSLPSSANSLPASTSSFPSSTSSSSSSSMSSSSSSPSPPYLSPDSITSDSSISSMYLSDSPAASPSAMSCSDLTSSTFSDFSNMKLCTSKLSPHSISTSSKFIDVNFTSQRCSKPATGPVRRFPPSIAERRGSLSKSLKLPVLTSDCHGKENPSRFPTNEQDDTGFNNDASLLSQSEDALQYKEGVITNSASEVRKSSDRLAVVELCTEESGPAKDSDTLWDNQSKASVSFSITSSGSTASNLLKPVVYRWPSLEKVLSFELNDLDSASVYIFVTPSLGFGNGKRLILYIWIGISFYCDKHEIQLDSSKKIVTISEIDWGKVTDDVMAHMDISKDDVDVKIVEEHEEPAEFLALLSRLRHHHSQGGIQQSC